MLKNILIVLVLVLGLLAMPKLFEFMAPPIFAETTTPEGNVESGAFMFDLSAITHTAIKGTTRQSWIRGGINYFFERIIGFLAAIISSLAVLMLSVGGFLMLSSGGDQTQYDKGVAYAKYALIGLGVTLLAYIMVTLVQLLIKSIYG